MSYEKQVMLKGLDTGKLFFDFFKVKIRSHHFACTKLFFITYNATSQIHMGF